MPARSKTRVGEYGGWVAKFRRHAQVLPQLLDAAKALGCRQWRWRRRWLVLDEAFEEDGARALLGGHLGHAALQALGHELREPRHRGRAAAAPRNVLFKHPMR